MRREGIARELVNRIQNLRKQSGLEITDKINITLSKNEQTDDAVVAFKDYICNQVLGASLVLADSVQDGVKLDMDEYELELKIDKI